MSLPIRCVPVKTSTKWGSPGFAGKHLHCWSATLHAALSACSALDKICRIWSRHMAAHRPGPQAINSFGNSTAIQKNRNNLIESEAVAVNLTSNLKFSRCNFFTLKKLKKQSKPAIETIKNLPSKPIHKQYWIAFNPFIQFVYNLLNWICQMKLFFF